MPTATEWEIESEKPSVASSGEWEVESEAPSRPGIPKPPLPPGLAQDFPSRNPAGQMQSTRPGIRALPPLTDQQYAATVKAQGQTPDPGLGPTITGGAQALQGARSVVTGKDISGDPISRIKGATQAIGGVLEAATPAMAPGIVAAPLESALVLGVGALSDVATRKALQQLDTPEEWQDLAGTVAGLVGGTAAGMGTKIAGEALFRRILRKALQDKVNADYQARADTERTARQEAAKPKKIGGEVPGPPAKPPEDIKEAEFEEVPAPPEPSPTGATVQEPAPLQPEEAYELPTGTVAVTSRTDGRVLYTKDGVPQKPVLESVFKRMVSGAAPPQKSVAGQGEWVPEAEAPAQEWVPESETPSDLFDLKPAQAAETAPSEAEREVIQPKQPAAVPEGAGAIETPEDSNAQPPLPVRVGSSGSEVLPLPEGVDVGVPGPAGTEEPRVPGLRQANGDQAGIAKGAEKAEAVAQKLGIRRRTGLPEKEQSAADKTRLQLAKDPDGFVAEYRKQFGNVFAADDAAELFDAYGKSEESRAGLHQAIHESSRWLRDAAFDKALADPKSPKRVIFTSGGSASGKSTVVPQLLKEGDSLVYDSTLSDLRGAQESIEKVLSAGKRVVIAHVRRDIEDSFRANLERAQSGAGRGRTTNITAMVRSHRGADEVISELAERYAKNPKVSIIAFDNKAGGPVQVNPSNLQKRDYTGVDARLFAALERDRANLPAHVYRAGLGAYKPSGNRGSEEVRGQAGSVTERLPAGGPSNQSRVHPPREVAPARKLSSTQVNLPEEFASLKAEKSVAGQTTPAQAFRMKAQQLQGLADKGDAGAQTELDRRRQKRGIVTTPEAVKAETKPLLVETKQAEPETKAPPAVQKVTAGKITADVLRKGADALQNQIDAKRNSGIFQQNPTRRRNDMAEGITKDADRLERIQKGLRTLADLHESGQVPAIISRVRSRSAFESLLPSYHEHGPERGTRREARFPSAYISSYPAKEIIDKIQGTKGNAEGKFIVLKAQRDGARITEKEIPFVEAAIDSAEKKGFNGKSLRESIATAKRLYNIGINEGNYKNAVDAVEALGVKKREPTTEEKIAKAERDLAIGSKIEGFFPTPKPLAKEMVQKADIRQGMTVLEPSAGNGNIADSIREEGTEPDVIEPYSTLRGILEQKKHNLIGSDFLEETGKYDRIVMNPPFERGQDMDHVQHAYELLKPGGRIVAIMSEGSFGRSDKKATAFREWLEEHNGTDEKLPEGSFTGKDSMRQTGVAARMVVIDKPVEKAPQKSPNGKKETAESLPPEVEEQALRAWAENRAYIKNGQYHLKGPNTYGPIAPWNKQIKTKYPTHEELHKAAQGYKPEKAAIAASKAAVEEPETEDGVEPFAAENKAPEPAEEENGRPPIEAKASRVEFGKEKTELGKKTFTAYGLTEDGQPTGERVEIKQSRNSGDWDIERSYYETPPGEQNKYGHKKTQSLGTGYTKADAKQVAEAFLKGEPSPFAEVEAGLPMSEYKPGSAKIEDPGAGRFGFNGPIEYEGRTWHTNGHFLSVGPPPANWKGRGLGPDHPGPEIGKVMPDKKGDTVEPVGFYKQGSSEYVVFSNGGAVQSKYFDYVNKTNKPDSWSAIPPEVKVNGKSKVVQEAYQAHKDGKLVALVMPIRNDDVPEKLKGKIQQRTNEEPARESRAEGEDLFDAAGVIRTAFRNKILWVNSAGMKKLAEAFGADAVNGMYIPSGKAAGLLGKVAPELRPGITAALRAGPTITVVRMDPGQSISQSKAKARHELFHATEEWGGEGRAKDLLEHPLAQRASALLAGGGYDAKNPALMFSEIGAHLASGPVGWEAMGLDREEARQLWKQYMRLLDDRTVADLDRVTPQLKRELNAERSIRREQTELGQAGSGQDEDLEGGAEQERPGVRQGVRSDVPGEGTRPQGTGKVKESKLAQGVEEKAIANGLTEGFEGRPEYQTVNIADQAKQAAELLKSDPDRAIEIAMGRGVPPNGLLPESVFVAVENYATANKDVNLLRELATSSSLSLEATGMGQRIRMLGERNPDSAVAAMQKVADAREAAAKKRYGPKAKETIKKQIKESIKKASPKKHDWATFLESIVCK